MHLFPSIFIAIFILLSQTSIATPRADELARMSSLQRAQLQDQLTLEKTYQRIRTSVPPLEQATHYFEQITESVKEFKRLFAEVQQTDPRPYAQSQRSETLNQRTGGFDQIAATEVLEEPDIIAWLRSFSKELHAIPVFIENEAEWRKHGLISSHPPFEPAMRECFDALTALYNDGTYDPQYYEDRKNDIVDRIIQERRAKKLPLNKDEIDQAITTMFSEMKRVNLLIDVFFAWLHYKKVQQVERIQATFHGIPRQYTHWKTTFTYQPSGWIELTALPSGTPSVWEKEEIKSPQEAISLIRTQLQAIENDLIAAPQKAERDTTRIYSELQKKPVAQEYLPYVEKYIPSRIQLKAALHQNRLMDISSHLAELETLYNDVTSNYPALTVPDISAKINALNKQLDTTTQRLFHEIEYGEPLIPRVDNDIKKYLNMDQLTNPTTSLELMYKMAALSATTTGLIAQDIQYIEALKAELKKDKADAEYQSNMNALRKDQRELEAALKLYAQYGLQWVSKLEKFPAREFAKLKKVTGYETIKDLKKQLSRYTSIWQRQSSYSGIM